MKTMKKLAALLLAAVMVLSMSVGVLADGRPDNLPADGSITITNATKDVEYEAYKIFDLTYTQNTDDSVLGLTDGKFTKKTSNAALLAAMQDSDVFVVTPEKVVVDGVEKDSETEFTVKLADGKTEANVREFMQANADKLPAEATSYTYTEIDPAFTAALTDATYSPFKLTAVPGSDKKYTVEVKDKFTVKKTDSEGVETEEEVPVTGKLIGEWLKKNESVVKTGCTKYEPSPKKTAADGNVVINNLPYGYYYVTSSLGTAVTVDSTLKDVKVVDKNQKPDWHDPDDEDDTPDDDKTDDGKYIIEGTEKVKVNEASIGDTIDFVIPVNAPNYNGSNTITDYTIIDKLPAGMTFNQGEAASVAANIKVYVDGTALTASTATSIKDLYTAEGKDKYIITMDADGQGFKIQIPWAYKTTDTVKKDDGTEAVTTAYVPNYAPDSKHVLEVKYSATLNENATVETANENKAYFTWQEIPDEEEDDNPHDPHYDDPKDPHDPENPHDPDEPFTDEVLGKLPESHTKTYTDQITINKVDPDGKKLTGAEFAIDGQYQNVVVVNSTVFVKTTDMAATDKDYANIEKNDSTPVIYYMLKDGTYTKTAPSATAGANTNYASTTDTYYKVTKVNELEDDGVKDYQNVGYVNSEGVLTFKGLGAGEYTITEEVAPEGYNRLTNPIKIKVELFDVTKANADKVKADALAAYENQYNTDELKATDEAKAVYEGIITTYETSLKSKGDHEMKLNVYEWDSAKETYKTEALGSGNVQYTVVNTTGSELPATGGIGTKIFYVLGGVMIVGAAVLLITKRRMTA